MSRKLLFVPLLLAATVVTAEEPAGTEADAPAAGTPAEAAVAEAEPTTESTGAAEAETPRQEGPKVISGMSVLGNQEAPKSLVIVPWKTSELGDSLGITAMLDDSRQPIDRDVFMRALTYYEIRSETTP